MMLAGVPVLADAVAELAGTVRTIGAHELADRLEVAPEDDVKLLALTIDERAIILGSLEEPQLVWAVDRSLATRDASAGIKNPKRKRHERRPIVPFESWAEVELVTTELHPRYRAIPVFAVGTGLRPEEWIALERGDVDREAGVVHVRRRFS